MARTIKFKSNEQKELYEKFLCFLTACIPSYRMPAKDYYSKINRSIKSYLLKKDIVIEHILELTNVESVEGFLNEIESYFVYTRKDDVKTEGLKYYLSFLKSLKDEREENDKVNIIEFEPITEEYKEGSLLDCHGSKYERDLKARKKCLEYYGYQCRICGFDFELVYGNRGKEFIEVHHKTALAEYKGEEHRVDPITDLIPICSNCHSMLHRTRPAMSVEELFAIVKDRICK